MTLPREGLWIGGPVEPGLIDEEYITAIENAGGSPDFIAALRKQNLRVMGVRRDWSPLVICGFIAYGVGLLLSASFI